MHSRMMGTVLTVVLALSSVAAAKIVYVDSELSPTVPGTVAYWPMDDNVATKVVLDSSPNLLKGTSVRNTSAMSIEGRVGRAFRFDGTGDFIDFGTNAKLLPDAWTFCAWVKAEDMIKPQLISFGGSYPGVKLQQDSGGKPLIFMGASNYRYFDASAWTTLKDGQWHFVVFSIPGKAQTDIQNSKMYLDGAAVAVSSTVATGPQQAKTRCVIGNNTITGLHRFKGAMDNARLYNRALTDAEVQQIYQSFSAGGNWASAFNTIGEAITAAAANDEIWVKKGTYILTQPLTVDKALKFYGGFAGTETDLAQRNIQLNPTTVNGNNAVYHCFQVTTDATIDGFTITRGKATGPLANDRSGGGIYSSNGFLTVVNCVVNNNTATTTGGGLALNGNSAVQYCQISDNTAGSAAGVYASGAEFTIEDCQITGNIATNQGGGLFCSGNSPVINEVTLHNNKAVSGAGVYLENSSAHLSNCVLSENQASSNGGGVYNFGGDSESSFRSCRLAANTAGGKGGALFSTGGTLSNLNHPELSNCVVVLNGAEDGGALYFDQYASGDILNCTITGNHAQRGGGMFVSESYSYTRIMNTILWGDSSVTGHPEIHFVPTGETESYPANMALYYNDIMTGWDLNSVKDGNLALDPAFADPDGPDNSLATWADNDYRLLSGSPLIDKGIAQYSALFAPTTDFRGTTRPQGAGYEMGAYEYAIGQGLSFRADFDLDYSYTAPAQTQTFTASTQSCDVTWWLGLTNTSGGMETWTLNSVTFETPNTLGNFFPSNPAISDNQYIWNDLTVTNKTELEAQQTTVKKDIAIPFSVTRAYAGNAILGSGDMTTTVTVTPEAGLESFSVKIAVAPAWTEEDWWNGQFIGTVEELLPAQVTGNTSGQLSQSNTLELQEYEWQFTEYTFGQPITFTIQTHVALNPGIPTAYLEPIVTVSGNLSADYGTEKWQNGTLTLPNGNGRVILDSASSKLTLDGYLPWYELVLPHFAKPITGDANNDNNTNMQDLLILSEFWLMPCNGANNFCDGADFDRNGKVDLTDFIFLSEFWLRNQDI